MGKYIRISIFLLCIVHCEMSHAEINNLRRDSADHDNFNKRADRYFFYLEFFGNNYRSPVLKRMSSVSINYSQEKYGEKLCLNLNVGVGFFRSFYFDRNGNSYDLHEPWSICPNVCFLLKKNNKRNGIWVGAAYTFAIARQDYYTDNLQVAYKKTRYFDYQVMPNFCYEFKSKSEKTLIRFSYTPKISSGLLSNDDGYDWTFLPFWGGISIGGGW